MINKERFEGLKNLSPLEAVRAWLEGDFGMGDEPALLEAIRRDQRVTGSDDQIIDFMADALLEERQDAQECLDRLARKE